MQIDSPRMATLLGKTVLWPMRYIKRVNILYSMGTPKLIGSAILCATSPTRDDSVLPTGTESSGTAQSPTEGPTVSTYHSRDPSKAVVICNLDLVQGSPDVALLRYRYAEWYSAPYFKPLIRDHFPKTDTTARAGPPKMLTPSTIAASNALLWHRDWIERFS